MVRMLKELTESVIQGHTPNDEEKAQLLKAAEIIRHESERCPGFDKSLYGWERWLANYKG